MPTTITACPSPASQTSHALDVHALGGSFAIARWKPAMVIAIISACAWLPTVHQRAHYSDDYPHRVALEAHGYWGTFAHYQHVAGWIRPAGYASLLAMQAYLWETPAVQQATLGLLHIALCIAAFGFVRRLCGCDRTALLGAGLLALWPSCTGNYVWVAGAAQILPACILLLVSLGCYLRHASGEGRRWWRWSLAAFAASIFFHDQHLALAGVFSLLAWLYGDRNRRVVRVMWTLAFWLASAMVGAMAITTSATSDRPLSPSLGGALGMLPAVISRFLVLSFGEPIQLSLHRAGPAESISRMLAADPMLLVLSSIGLVIGGAALVFGGSIPSSPTRKRSKQPAEGPSAGRLCLVGMAIVLAGLALIAARPGGGMSPRHTMLPAIGASMVAAAGLTQLESWTLRRNQRLPVFAVRATICAALLGLGGLRLGAMYEWTTRTRITDAVLDRLAVVQSEAWNRPTKQPIAADQLIILDGVRRFGRGFADSWGLTGAATLRLGNPVRVATFVRREGDQLMANAAWDEPWPIDESTRYFRWNDAESTLSEVSLEQYLTRHPDLEGNHG